MKLKKSILLEILILILLSYLVIWINYKYNIVEIPRKKNINSSSFNLFTIASVMEGFAFTVLGLLFSFDSTSYVKKIKGINLIIDKASIILRSIIMLGISGSCSLGVIIFTVRKIDKILFIVSIVFLISGLIWFIKSVSSVYKLILQIHEYDRIKIDKKYNRFKKSQEERKNLSSMQDNEEINEEDEGTW